MLIFKHSHIRYLILIGILIFLGLTPLWASIFPPKTVELEYNTAEIILPDGRTIKENIVVKDDLLFIPYEALEEITSENINWNPEDQTLTIGNLSFAEAMSDKLKVYHYSYDVNRAYLYAPDVRTNKTMTMGSISHELGYSFSNVQSASFNLAGHYHHITGFLGCEDFKSANGAVSIYLDDTPLANYTLIADSLPEKLDLDVTGGSQLKLVFSNFTPNSQIDLADVYIE